ncbi:MAG: hypothetical protein MMC23_008646 [Stictis urceolatum]|nr:hypothetical protein [Stictis urceolata]
MPSSLNPHLSDSRGYKVIVISTVLIIAMLAAITARLLARKKKSLPFRLDDYLILPAFVLAFSICILTIASVPTLGLGLHIEAATAKHPNAADLLRKMNFAHHVLSYSGAIVFAKLSVCSFYNRVFTHTPWVRNATCFVTGITLALGLAVFLAPFVVCRPWTWIFTGAHPSSSFAAHCVNWQWYLTYISLPNILTDLILLSIPLPIIWKLNQTLPQKVGLSIAFTLGGLNTICSCIRFYAFADWTAHPSTDTSWHAVEPATWVTVEASTLVIAACIPHLRPLVKWIVPKAPPRERLHEATPRGLRGPCRLLMWLEDRMNKGSGKTRGPCKVLGWLEKKVNRDQGEEEEQKAWWRVLRAREGERQGVVREIEEDEVIAGARVSAGSEGSREKRTERWLQDLECGREGKDEVEMRKLKGAPWSGIVVFEEIVVVTEAVNVYGRESVEERERYEGDG